MWGGTMIDDIEETIDWQGNPVDCSTCAHLDMNATGKCRLSHACVNDRYARRIDRFFHWNPDLANRYVNHPHFEVRAIAAKHAAVFLLPPLLDDPEETVRWNAARRLPKKTHSEIAPRSASRSAYPHRVPARRRRSGPDVARSGLLRPSGYCRGVWRPICWNGCCMTKKRRCGASSRTGSATTWLMRMAGRPGSGVRLEVAQRLAGEASVADAERSGLARALRSREPRRMLEELGELADDDDDLVREMACCRV